MYDVIQMSGRGRFSNAKGKSGQRTGRGGYNSASAMRTRPHPPAAPTGGSIYSQATDETCRPFIGRGWQFMGQSGMQSANPTPRQIRVKSIFGVGGMHEAVPTDMRQEVADSSIPGIQGVQSGLRSATSLTFFSNGSSHTNAALTGIGRSANTEGQASAHDSMRSEFRRMEEHPGDFTREEAVDCLAGPYLGSLATGRQLLENEGLTGCFAPGFGLEYGKPGSSERIQIARDYNARREESKFLATELAASRGHPRSVSPPRTPINPDGTGGGYAGPGDTLAFNPSPSFHVPLFGGTTPDEKSANETAFITRPLRHKPDSIPDLQQKLRDQFKQ